MAAAPTSPPRSPPLLGRAEEGEGYRRQTMPTVLRVSGYRFYFYSHESSEPPHVQVDRSGSTAKFWLETVTLARNAGA
jgi:Domain of unknown function (DUF4160)